MFKDLRAGLMHFGIFWGFVLLTIGTANVVTGGLVQAVVSWPLDGVLWTAVSVMQNVVAVVVLLAVAYAFYRRLVVTAEAADAEPVDGLVILAMIGGVVATELLAQAFEAARYGDVPGAFVADGLAGAAPDPRRVRDRGRLRHPVVGPHRARGGVPGVPAVRQAPPHRDGVFNVYFRKLAPRGELPAMDLEDETATFGLRTLQDLGWKDLLDGFTCTECGRCQAACPANATGKPLDPKAFIMGIREMAVEAEHGIDLHPELAARPRGVRPRRHGARRDPPGRADRRRGDPVRRGLGLRDLRRLRRGLPGPHRARRQDRRAAPQPGPRGLPLPAAS